MTPSCIALWASWKPPAQSPAALMPATFVCWAPSTVIMPRSTATPAFSSPMSSTLPARPTATRSTDACSRCSPSSPCTVTATLPSLRSTAAPDPDRAGRPLVEEQCVVTGEPLGAVALQSLHLAGTRPGGHDDVPGLQLHLILAGLAGHDHAAGLLDAPATTDHRCLGLLEQPLDALVELADHGVAAPRRHPVVEGHLAGGDTEAMTLADLVEQGRALQQRLGGDAAAVEARAAHLVGLHHGCPKTQLAGPDGGHVAARAPTQDDDVKSLRHGRSIGPVRAISSGLGGGRSGPV